MLVDDNDIDVFLNKKLIGIAGIEGEIISFTNSAEALNHLISQFENNQDLPKVMLVDIQMPEMNGFQFIEQLSQKMPEKLREIQVFFLSSTVHDEDAIRARENEFVQEILPKPLDSNYLAAQIK